MFKFTITYWNKTILNSIIAVKAIWVTFVLLRNKRLLHYGIYCKTDYRYAKTKYGMRGIMKGMSPPRPPFNRWKVRQSLLGGYKKDFPANDIPCGKTVIYSS